MDELLERYLAEARSCDVEIFAAKHRGAYLIGKISLESDGRGLGFQTDVGDTGDFSSLLGDRRRASAPRGDQGRFVVKVAKSDRNSFLSWISVGRAPNNDVVLRHPSVSKLHAQITANEVAGRDPEYTIADAGSSNGTFVNGLKKNRGELSRIGFGDLVQFGDLTCEFVNGRLLHGKLRALAQPTSLPGRQIDF